MCIWTLTKEAAKCRATSARVVVQKESSDCAKTGNAGLFQEFEALCRDRQPAVFGGAPMPVTDFRGRWVFAYRADVGSIRAIWAILDRIALDGPEEENIELKRETVAGQARNARSGIPRDRSQQTSSSLVTQRSPGSSQGGSPDVGFVRSSRRPALA